MGVPKCVQGWNMNLLTDLLTREAGKDGFKFDCMGALEIDHRRSPYRIR